MTDCLLIVDLQNDYFAGGAMELVGAEAAAANAGSLLRCFRGRGAPIVHLQHLAARPDATFFLPDTEGAEINAAVAPSEDETVVIKHYPNGFRDTGLLEQLRKREVDRLVICGAMSHMCIDATTRAVFDLGFACTVVEDACATRDLAFHGKTISATDVHAAFMAALAVPYAKIVSTQSIITGEA